MFALVRNADSVAWQDVRPESSDYGSLGPYEVEIRVRLVGLCRTDLAVANGELAVAVPRILGHEFVGEVVARGRLVEIAVGASVSANPVLVCGHCQRCRSGWQEACPLAKFLGVDCDGAIAESIVLPAQNLWIMPAEMDDRLAAMLEPVAACAAVTNAAISKQDRGLIAGDSRLARLTHRILLATGFEHVECCLTPQTDSYDFAIETEGTTASMDRLLNALRPRGVLVLKSRPIEPVSLDIRRWLAKEPQIHAVNYGSFSAAREMLVQSRIELTDLLGPIWPVTEFAAALHAAAHDDQVKHFLAVAVPHEVHQPIRRTEVVRNRCLQS